MFGLFERSRLSMHEKTLLQASEAASVEDSQTAYALAVGRAVASLASAIGFREECTVRRVVDEVPPYSLKAADALFVKEADAAARMGDWPNYYACTILAGVMLSKIVEVSKPGLALRAVRHRQTALDFLEPMLSRAVELLSDHQKAATGPSL